LAAVEDSFVLAADKTFDVTTTATVSGSAIDGVIAGERVMLSRSGKFINANVGADNPATFKNGSVGGDQANCSLSSTDGRTTAAILAP
jgi:hypothetical protein